MGAQWEPGRVASVCVMLSQSAGNGSGTPEWRTSFCHLEVLGVRRLL